MTTQINPLDLGFFSTLASAGSLRATARELGVTTPAVSKHLAVMEARLGTALVVRITRRMSLTPEGGLYLEHPRRILSELGDMEEVPRLPDIAHSRHTRQACAKQRRAATRIAGFVQPQETA